MKPRYVGLAIGLVLAGGAFAFIFSNLWDTGSTSHLPMPSPSAASPSPSAASPSPSAASPSPSAASPSPSAASPSPSLIPTSLLCLNKTTKLLRTSNVVDQCLASESSLGAYRIPIPTELPNDLNPFFKVRFIAAQAAAKRVGITLAITSGFRSYATQQALFAEALKKYGSVAAASKWVLPPELSHHVLGLALDINYPNDPKSTKWLEINGSKFGICRVYTNEWWHFEGAVAPGGRCPELVADATVALLDD